nr:MAG TPA: hypothetical protein [Caudoviricetes sp.]
MTIASLLARSLLKPVTPRSICSTWCSTRTTWTGRPRRGRPRRRPPCGALRRAWTGKLLGIWVPGVASMGAAWGSPGRPSWILPLIGS